MSSIPVGVARHAPAAQRNKGPILEVLKKYLGPPAKPSVLEVASGTGDHVSHLARHLPDATFTPTDVDAKSLPDIRACVREEFDGADPPNVLMPRQLDASKPEEVIQQFSSSSYDTIYCSNMMHIAPYSCSIGLMKLSGSLLPQGGRLFTYGPYKIDGVLSPESNVAFDASLRSRNSEWGIRDTKDLKKEAEKNGLSLEAMHDMPANNKLLVWKKQ